MIQVVTDGRQLTAANLFRCSSEKQQLLSLNKPILVTDTPLSIGMKIPSKTLSIRDIADTIGHSYPVHVIDVEHQEELEGWTLADLVDYFEDEERLFALDAQEAAQIHTNNTKTNSNSSYRRRRKAAKKRSSYSQNQRVLNQISLEFSKTPLKHKFASPQFVRDIDWIDHAWPRNRQNVQDDVYPNVQYYCLTSAAGCYTDFHVDFGGTAVWYHILSGQKQFCLIPPTKQNLAVYEDWLGRPDQAAVFLPDLIQPPEQVIRITMQPGQTLIIPTAWIHAVYTPTDSIVMGGNFLHSLDMPGQLEVQHLECRTRVQEKFRFPFFREIHFYAGGTMLQRLREGSICQAEMEGLPSLLYALQEWWKVDSKGTVGLQTGPTVVRAANTAAQANGCSSVEECLQQLGQEYQRVLQRGIQSDNVRPPGVPKSNSETTTTTTTTTARLPKLKLKLSSKTATTTNDSSASKTTKFRISLSSTAIPQKPPPFLKTKRPREDTEWIADQPSSAMDDEWMPLTTCGGSNSSKQRRMTSPRPKPTKSKPTTTTSSSCKPTKKATSARQRLMKRFR